jgi:hypothetical protein
MEGHLAPLEGSRFKSRTNDFVIFFSVRGRRVRVLNRRLPRITARDVLPIVPFGLFRHSTCRQT